jgi:hypothetical protein
MQRISAGLIWDGDGDGNDMRRRIFADVEMVGLINGSAEAGVEMGISTRAVVGRVGWRGADVPLGRQSDGDAGTVGTRAFLAERCWACALAPVGCCGLLWPIVAYCGLLWPAARRSPASPLPPVLDPSQRSWLSTGLQILGAAECWANGSRTRRVFPVSR